jgi:ABC-type Fe3+-hydroxamate transport system substrate-binding protein/adenosylcobinamide amidohydrolase
MTALGRKTICGRVFRTLFVIAGLFLSSTPAFSYPVDFVDDQGRKIHITKRPQRVVSLTPAITEIIFKIGAGDALAGITYHSSHLTGALHKRIVGGYGSPSSKKIEEIGPDVVFLSSLHRQTYKRLSHRRCKLVLFENDSIAEGLKTIGLLGKIFDREEKADQLVLRIRDQLSIIAKKTGRIPPEKRKRVIRIMGLDPLTIPGDDSFQNEMIRAAGGVAPKLGRKGHITTLSREEWVRFNPQVIYGCGGDRGEFRRFFERPGWRDVDAVKTGNIYQFPCDLTCRISAGTGDFVSWLSAVMYAEEFSKKKDQALEDEVLDSRALDLRLGYVKDAGIWKSRIRDFVNKTLVIDFNGPLTVLSTAEGWRTGIRSVGNHFLPPPSWGIGHKGGLRALQSRVYAVIAQSQNTASFLFTGADMDHLAIKRASFKDMEVLALVTAGVRSNAVRMSRDEGRFYELGTINVILMTNTKLTPRAMARAIISATEAKTAALMDMDVRSSVSPSVHQATGTGTDNMIVVQGAGRLVDKTGGHTKMGELIGRAVYAGVREAVYLQNGMAGERDVFQRLRERRINLFTLASCCRCGYGMGRARITGLLEEILLNPRYAAFLEASLALSDSYERGLVHDLGAYDLLCREITREIAGKDVQPGACLVTAKDVTPVMRKAWNALLNGICVTLKDPE